MQINQLSLKDRPVLEKFLSLKEHSLSAYAFENIFIWRSLYDIFWIKIDKMLCVFFKDRVGCFLYLPPLGKDLSLNTVNKCFKTMDHFNKNTIISRIENVEKNDIEFYKNFGYRVILGGGDYICKKKDLVYLRGVHFKKKRSALNFFVKNYDFRYRDYSGKDREECIDLYVLWTKERKGRNKDAIYQGLLDDNFSIFKTALDYYKKLNFVGRVIRIKDKIVATTFGYPQSKKSFVILFEVCDLSFKGVAQYIFREFCRELDYKEINIMDDSGLDNLKRVKLSYQPHKIIDNFVVSNE